MAVTYTYDLATDLGKLRLLIQDTNVTDGIDSAVFSDEELNFFVGETQDGDTVNLYAAASLALEANATDKARLAKRKKMDVLSSDTTEIAVQLWEAADRYKAKAEEFTLNASLGSIGSQNEVDFADLSVTLLELEPSAGDA